MRVDSRKCTPLDGRIIAYASDWQAPSGGIRKLYRHVDVLHAAGYPAMIAHGPPGFRCSWFANETPVVYPPDSYASPSDIMLVPEIHSWDIANQSPGIAKVIFNQNAYQTFLWQVPQADPKVAPYQRPDVHATIVVSEDNRQYLQFAFPGHPVFRIRYSIDPQLFFLTPDKKRQIAYMPRKLPDHAAQVLSILQSRGALSTFELVPIENMNESQVAAVLRDSQVFLSFASEEGWSLPAMEAMACGCVTIGYHGRGGTEFFTEDRGFPMVKNDIIGFASTVERVLTELKHDQGHLREMARVASQHVLSSYTPQREEQDILQAWDQIFALRSLQRRPAITPAPAQSIQPD